MAWTFYTNGAEKTSLSTVPNNAVRAKTAVAQSIPNNAFTGVDLELEDYDYGGLHVLTPSPTNRRLTAVVDGVYSITGSLNFAASTSGDRGVRILLNGATVIARSFGVTDSTSGEQPSISCTTHYYLTAGNYVELNAFQNSGASLNLDLTATAPSLQMALISPLSTVNGSELTNQVYVDRQDMFYA